MRLIDADKLKEKKEYSKARHEYIVSVAQIDWQPTIQPQGIDKDRLIEFLESRIECADGWDDYQLAFKELLAWVNQQPQTDVPDIYVGEIPQPQTGWIPVSERLPDDEREVLITDVADDVFVGWYDERYNEWLRTNCIVKNIVAWQPLPQPYKESE